MLSERLPLLRPAPVIALTATATPLVQRDIVEQLAIPEARQFIHGFRRTNIAVEVAEAKPSARRALVRRVLTEPERRPAIVYAPTRKESEALATELNEIFPSAAYHAGMAADARDTVQRAFQKSEVEVIVATIAFGMGIDKPDIRTVIHTGLPGTLEGYYQEIGRAGRDGGPSRAVLLYSWADRRTHEFFLERDYPETGVLEKLFAALSERARPAAVIGAELGLEDEVFASALQKLWIHRGAVVDPEENASRGRSDWRASYEAQRAHRHDQIERMMGFASGRSCRMLHLVEHFGDQHDSGEACGTCDRCAPEGCLVTSFRKPKGAEIEVLAAALDLLRQRDGLASGQLYRQAAESTGRERKAFELLLDGLVRAGLVELQSDSFEKDGRTIRFQRVWLTRQGRLAGKGDVDGVSVARAIAVPSNTKRPRAKAAAAAVARQQAPLDAAEVTLFEKLREWRLQEARRRRVPAFTILTNRTLAAICRARPADDEELLEVSGIGPTTMRKFGRKVLAVVNAESPVDDDA
jgi:DNA topoisomerase-3